MKKVKLFLTGVAVLAVVGGAVAFKAKSFGAIPLYHEGTTPNFCDVIVAHVANGTDNTDNAAALGEPATCGTVEYTAE